MVAYSILKDQFHMENGRLIPFSDDGLYVEDAISFDEGVLTINRMFINASDAEITFLPCISVKTENTVSDWFIPSVSYSGNTFGDGMDPKGTSYKGEPWVFPSDRMGVPGCTVLMGGCGCSALFLSSEQIASACSLEIFENHAIQRAFFTHVEYPCSYASKSHYGDAIVNRITLLPHEKKCFRAYLFLADEVGTFGYRPLIRYLLDHYAVSPVRRDEPRMYEDSMSFLRRLVERREDMTLTNMGFLPRQKADGTGREFVYRRSGRYECGWCGQNISNAWLLLFDQMKKTELSLASEDAIAPFDMSFSVEGRFDTESEDFRDAIAILDSWQKFRLKSGLMPVLLDDVFKQKPLMLDLCNLGWLVYQYINCYVLLKNGGIDKEAYLETAKGVLDVLLPYPLQGKGFPQTVDAEGIVICDLGMAGTMMTVAALQMYRVTGEKKYFDAGKASFDFYYEHYLSHNAAAGGALDTYCIDKESAGPVLRAALMLERLTKDVSYIKKAENIACYLQTWMFYYDIPFPEGSDAWRHGFSTLGATAVSAQHHHLDCWASYYAPDLRYLSVISDDPMWRRAAEYIRSYAFQAISDGKTELHGIIRPAGAQNEAMFQSDWSFDGTHKKGEFNDWLVSWVNAFRLMDMDHEMLESMR